MIPNILKTTLIIPAAIVLGSLSDRLISSEIKSVPKTSEAEADKTKEEKEKKKKKRNKNKEAFFKKLFLKTIFIKDYIYNLILTQKED